MVIVPPMIRANSIRVTTPKKAPKRGVVGCSPGSPVESCLSSGFSRLPFRIARTASATMATATTKARVRSVIDTAGGSGGPLLISTNANPNTEPTKNPAKRVSIPGNYKGTLFH